MSDPYSIARAEPRHLDALPAIELAAARLLSGHAPRSVLEETTSHGTLTDAMKRGLLWVAVKGDSPVGFAHVEMLASDLPHLEEIDVHPDHGRRGLGRRLIRTVCQWATSAGYEHITLTTFRFVPWNMPWYARVGFVELPAAEWRDELRQRVESETARGLDPVRRVAMTYRCLRRGDGVVVCQDEAECRELEAFLEQRIYEFNAHVTGYLDGRLLAGRICDEAGDIVAGFSGYTWGGCCELSNVWVHERCRGQGFGTRLLGRAEAEARARGCRQIVVTTHTFQAPGFYERMGFERKYAIDGRPNGFQDVVYVKTLGGKDASAIYCSR